MLYIGSFYAILTQSRKEITIVTWLTICLPLKVFLCIVNLPFKIYTLVFLDFACVKGEFQGLNNILHFQCLYVDLDRYSRNMHNMSIFSRKEYCIIQLWGGHDPSKLMFRYINHSLLNKMTLHQLMLVTLHILSIYSLEIVCHTLWFYNPTRLNLSNREYIKLTPTLIYDYIKVGLLELS